MLLRRGNKQIMAIVIKNGILKTAARFLLWSNQGEKFRCSYKAVQVVLGAVVPAVIGNVIVVAAVVIA